MSNISKMKALAHFEDKELQFFIDEAYKIFKNPIVVYDIDWKIFGYAHGETGFWNNDIENGMLSTSMLEGYIREGGFNTAINSKRAIYLDCESINHQGLYSKVFDASGMPIACVGVIKENSPFDHDCLDVLNAFCTILSSEIQKIPYYQTYAQQRMDIYVAKLIEKNIDNKPYVLGFVEMIYTNLLNNLYVAVALAPLDKQDPFSLDAYRSKLKKLQPKFKYAVYDSYIIIIMSTDKSSEDFCPLEFLLPLENYLAENNFKLGLSCWFENLFNLSTHYKQALRALNKGLKEGAKNLAFVCED